MNLATIPWRSTRYPGIAVHFYASDRKTGRVVALIRMERGRGYPQHRHHGREDVLVLRGSYEDESGHHATGSFVVYEDGTEHGPVATLSDGEHCVLLAVAHEGVTLLGT